MTDVKRKGERGALKPAGNGPKMVSGKPMSGRILRLAAGMGHGYIRAEGGEDVFFHRSDTQEGVFNTLEIDDDVRFELVEDRVSGARAIRVRRMTPKKGRLDLEETKP